MKSTMRQAACVLALLASMSAPAAGTGAQPGPVDEARLQGLATQLRCPVCQNQSLADSDAELAADLRTEIRRQLEAGRSDEEIRRFMVARYGDFVLYDPPLRASTSLLWLAPFGLLGAGALVLAGRLRAGRRRGMRADPVSGADATGEP